MFEVNRHTLLGIIMDKSDKLQLVSKWHIVFFGVGGSGVVLGGVFSIQDSLSLIIHINTGYPYKLLSG